MRTPALGFKRAMFNAMVKLPDIPHTPIGTTIDILLLVTLAL
jgi:hypothetical protein